MRELLFLSVKRNVKGPICIARFTEGAGRDRTITGPVGLRLVRYGKKKLNPCSEIICGLCSLVGITFFKWFK